MYEKLSSSPTTPLPESPSQVCPFTFVAQITFFLPLVQGMVLMIACRQSKDIKQKFFYKGPFLKGVYTGRGLAQNADKGGRGS